MPWDLTGNATTNPTSNYLGTKDNQPIVFKTNAKEAFRVDGTGKLGIGTVKPATKVEIVGNWTGEDGALRISGDKPTIRLTAGAIGGNKSWIMHVGSDGGGNLQFYRRTGAATWTHAMSLTTAGTIRVGTNGSTSATLHGEGAADVVGVWGQSKTAPGVVGKSEGPGVYGESSKFNGVRGISYAPGHGAVVGVNENATEGAGPGVYGLSAQGAGVAGESTRFNAIRGISHGIWHAAVVGVNDNATDSAGAGVYCESGTVGIHAKSRRLAGFFEGDVEVTGDIRLRNADCAEHFEIAAATNAEPGTVMALSKDGTLEESREPYNKRVVGVISGAGSYKPGIVLDKQSSDTRRLPIGLVGKVYCKVDATVASIEIGDLLTTSAIPGHAMKAEDSAKAFGAVIGKALASLREGTGLIPVLIALQ